MTEPTTSTLAGIDLSRRRAIGLGALAGVGAFWSPLARADAVSRPGTKAKSVILIFNCGALSHIDLWDPKPDAPAEIRGPFRPVSTAVPGLQVTELLPRMAERADRLAVVRTVHHAQGQHNSGMYWSTVGRRYPIDSTLINPTRADYPCFGTLVGWLARRDGYGGPLPPYVITPYPYCDSTKYLTPGQFGGCLGPRHDPFVLNADPNARDFRVAWLGPIEGLTETRLAERRSLLNRLDAAGRTVASDAVLDLAVSREKALALATSADAAAAFDLSKEPDAVRERYGRHAWGQSHLLARRLVEAGVRFVTTVNGQSIVWDTHKDNFNSLQKRLVPPMEQAYAALLDDLQERGLLDSTLVVWMGDFGRSPVVNKDVGRDHWPQCYSVVFAGGGIRSGQVVGESDRTSSAPKTRPVTPADLHATVFSLLGYDPHAITYQTADGRPTPLSDGEPIRELL